MRVTAITLPCATGNKVRYLAVEQSPLVFVSRVGITHLDAIKRCLNEFNKRVHYDE